MADFDLDPSLAGHRAGLIMFDPLNIYLHPEDAQREQNLQEWRTRENMKKLVDGARAHKVNIFYGCGDHMHLTAQMWLSA